MLGLSRVQVLPYRRARYLTLTCSRNREGEEAGEGGGGGGRRRYHLELNCEVV